MVPYLRLAVEKLISIRKFVGKSAAYDALQSLSSSPTPKPIPAGSAWCRLASGLWLICRANQAPVAGQNFIDYLDWGDLLGNFGFHFGTVKEVGSIEDLLVALRAVCQGDSEAALQFHRLTHYATDLGLTPSGATLVSATDLGLTPSKSVTDTNPNLGVQSESNSMSLFIQHMASFTTQGQLDSRTMTNHDDVNSPSFLAVSHV